MPLTAAQERRAQERADAEARRQERIGQRILRQTQEAQAREERAALRAAHHQQIVGSFQETLGQRIVKQTQRENQRRADHAASAAAKAARDQERMALARDREAVRNRDRALKAQMQAQRYLDYQKRQLLKTAPKGSKAAVGPHGELKIIPPGSILNEADIAQGLEPLPTFSI